MDAMKLRIATGTLSVIIFIVSVCAFAPQTVGQISDQISEEDRLEIEARLERELGMAQDPSPRPPPPDDLNEPDVAKRKRFGWELGRKRLSFGCPLNIDLLKEATNDIPQERKANLLERFSTLLAHDLRPTNPEMVQWYGQWLSSRDGRRLHLIVAEWSVDDIVVRALQLADSDRYVRILVRFPKRPSLRFRRPSQSELSGDQLFRWEYVSKTGMRHFLVEMFGLPYDSGEEFDLHGYVTTCGGVDVFTGAIRPAWARARPADGEEVPQDRPKVWQLRNRILITDSDPQYVCVSFDLRESGKGETPQP